MQTLAALHELAELAASYSAAHERSRASRPSQVVARAADAALILSAIDAMSWGSLRTCAGGRARGLGAAGGVGFGPPIKSGATEEWWRG